MKHILCRRSTGRNVYGLLAAMVLLVGVSGCGGDGESIAFSVTLEVVDEAGAPVADATVDIGSDEFTTDNKGRVVLADLESPVVALVSSAGLLTEPVAIGRSDASTVVSVRVLSSKGGQRWVMHAGGDAMFGRRYVEPPTGQPLIEIDRAADGARYVVQNLVRAFSVANVRAVNLETVVADLPDSARYPGKRFILKSHPDTLAGIQAIGADIVTLGNNHSRDFLDQGVAETVGNLDARGIKHVGGSSLGSFDPDTMPPDAPADSTPADMPVYMDAAGARVAFLSWTTVDGNFVNDNYPMSGVPEPTGCLASPPTRTDCYQYDERMWGYSGITFNAVMAPRRIYDAWLVYSQAESDPDMPMSDMDRSLAWQSLVAVYPELQDWTAGRGHGGAAPWVTTKSKTWIGIAKANADVVVVNLHSGFQFQSAPSSFVRLVARHAIDAGADIVIAHHPHVLQGAEWYKGKLIAYSMGNFIFDQDFLATFPSVFLRTVWEGSTLVEARFVVLELVGYRPTLVTDKVAIRTVRMLWERSALGAHSDRDNNDDVRTYLPTGPDPDTKVAHMRMRHHDAVIVDTPPAVESLHMDVGQETKAIDYDGLVQAQAGGADVQLGRELFGWGHFEDALADGVARVGSQWVLAQNGGGYDPAVVMDGKTKSGLGYLLLARHDGLEGDTYARPLARIPLPEHLLFRDQGGQAIPVDGDATYTIRMLARLRGKGQPYLRLELNHFDDTNPTEDPTTEPIGDDLEIPLEVRGDGKWHEVEIELPPEKLSANGIRANVIMPNLRFAPPQDGESELAIDNFEIIEWRAAKELSDHYGAYDFIRNSKTGKVAVDLEVMPLRD